MRRLSDRFTDETNAFHAGESALLTIIPGEQHSFGLSMVAEVFRRAGWNLCTGPFSSHQELTSLVQNHWFDIVGFSVSSDRRLDELKKDIHDIRRDSRNRHIGIIIGGPMVVAHPDLVASMGADMMSADATTAPQQAHAVPPRSQRFPEEIPDRQGQGRSGHGLDQDDVQACRRTAAQGRHRLRQQILRKEIAAAHVAG